MNRRSIITMMAVGVIGFCASSIARADEVLKFRMFVHATSVQSQEVPDVDGHVLYVGRYSGLASFSDESVGPGNLTFTADYVKGAGTFSTYFSVSPNNSTLWVQSNRDRETRGHDDCFFRSAGHCARRFGKV
jgi:hypothetical protein